MRVECEAALLCSVSGQLKKGQKWRARPWAGPTYRPEHPKGTKDEVNRPEGPLARLLCYYIFCVDRVCIFSYWLSILSFEILKSSKMTPELGWKVFLSHWLDCMHSPHLLRLWYLSQLCQSAFDIEHNWIEFILHIIDFVKLSILEEEKNISKQRQRHKLLLFLTYLTQIKAKFSTQSKKHFWSKICWCERREVSGWDEQT